MLDRMKLLASLILTLTLLVTNVPLNVNAQAITLSVSAMDTGGKFFGPQIVQVVVDGPSIRNPDANAAPLVIRGETVPLVQLSDGRWYAFFANANAFTTLATTAGFPGFSDGNFWIIGPSGKNQIFPILSGAFGHDSNSTVNPNLDINGDCPAVITAQDLCVEWPYIRLFNLSENDQVSVRYSGQSVTLQYVKPSSDDITLALDRDFYPINAEIIFGLSDYMWNINPVERDRVAFAFGDGGTEVFYQPSISLPPASITGIMQSIGFDFNQILSLQGKEAIRFTHSINGIPATILVETFPNSGVLENFDGRADMFAKERNVQFRFDYFNKSISAGMGTSDASISIGKEEPKTDPEVPEVKEETRIEPYAVSEPTLVDIMGETIESIAVEQVVLIQTMITNNLDEEQPFVYIVQVKDEEGFTVMLTWIKGSMYAGTSFNTDISWTPESEGDYIIETFVWKSIDDPGIGAITKELQISVS